MLKSIGLAIPAVLIAGGLALAAQNSSLGTADHWLMSDVYKAPVYDANNNKIGEIDNLVLSSDGQIKTAVIGVGGFLGVGQKDVAVPFNQLKVGSQNGNQELTLDMTKDQLKAAPAWNKDSNAG
jgi:sporulation protein YlmC with PRC-barrel domain